MWPGSSAWDDRKKTSVVAFLKAVLWKGSPGCLFILQGSYLVQVIKHIKLKLEAAAGQNAKALMEACKEKLRNLLPLYLSATLFQTRQTYQHRILSHGKIDQASPVLQVLFKGYSISAVIFKAVEGKFPSSSCIHPSFVQHHWLCYYTLLGGKY